MGHLMLPSSGNVYIDANVVIYSIEKIQPYWQILHPLWQAVQSGILSVVTSELTVMETLVKPFQTNDITMERLYRSLFVAPGVQLEPIRAKILERTARLRAGATSRFRTPDAIHAAASLITRCTLFITNDKDYRQCPDLPVVLLSDLVTI